MKILITGANGYIGKHVIDELIKENHEVIAIDLEFDKLKSINCKKIRCDIFKSDLLLKYAKDSDVLIHLAWRDGFNLNSYKHINDISNHFIFLTNMISSGVRHIAVLGSMHEIGYYEGEVTENTKTAPSNIYGISKKLLYVALDKYCNDHNVIFQWIRGFYLTGDDELNNSIFQKIILAAKNGKREFPFTNGKNKFDFIDINIFSRNIVKVVEQDKITGIINNCSGKAVSLGEKVEEFIVANNLDIILKYGMYPERDDESKAIWGNIEKLNKILENR